MFYWFGVPYDRLFVDALERDLRREQLALPPTTQAVREPAISIALSSDRTISQQIRILAAPALMTSNDLTPGRSDLLTASCGQSGISEGKASQSETPIILKQSASRSFPRQERQVRRAGNRNACPHPNCDRSFTRKEHLKRHLQTHTNNRPFACQVCTKSFSRKDNLSAHVSTASLTTRPRACPDNTCA